jgi:hypothetical protein
MIFTLLVVFVILIFFFFLGNPLKQPFSTNDSTKDITSYIQQFKDKEHRIFPFRYFTDSLDNVLPFVAVTGPFRDKKAKERFNEYKSKGIHIFGITAYKSFPNNKLFGEEEGEYERNDDFNYVDEIKNWLCCFSNKQMYGFSVFNNVVDISESDFYNAEPEPEDKDKVKEKKYDFIYICNKDDDKCPLKGWNAINRNFGLALKCFPVLCNQLQMKGLIVGRVGCGLEKEYGDKMEVVDWLDWHILQEKMRESKMLFLPNVYDASPRVIAECITKGLPVLMNKKILCGSKYITYETGEFFTDEVDLKSAVTKLQNRMFKISPRKWWFENYSQERSQKNLQKFLADAFPGSGYLTTVDRVQFIL